MLHGKPSRYILSLSFADDSSALQKQTGLSSDAHIDLAYNPHLLQDNASPTMAA
jgi:hypothetical protein